MFGFALHWESQPEFVLISMLRSILPDVLDEVHAWQDDSSVASNSKMSITSGMTWASAAIDADLDIQWEGLSVASSVSAGSGVYASPDRLLHVCKEIDAPLEFIELVGQHLLGMDMAKVDATDQLEKSMGKPPSLQGTVNFMAQAFQLCTRGASLVVIALDNVHHMDEMSWKVLYKLFITSRNLLIICTSHPLTTHKLAIEESFWKELNEKYLGQKRFVPMDLHALGEGDIRTFLARELGVQEEAIGEKFHQDFFIQTGGMPYFANEMLQDLKRCKMIGIGSDNLFGCHDSKKWKNEVRKDVPVFFLGCDKKKMHLICVSPYFRFVFITKLAAASVGELLVHRVDAFDSNVRNVLNLGAVLGDSFKLLEIITVLQELDGATRSQEIPHAENIISSLDLLVEEGILRQMFEGGEDLSSNDNAVAENPSPTLLPWNGEKLRKWNIENRLYTFCHGLWRSSILKLMLDSRKKDIHRTIAMVLEAQQVDDYEPSIKLLGHWKASGDFSKAASLSLLIGKSFEELALHDQSIRLYEDTLEMWKDAQQLGESVGGKYLTCKMSQCVDHQVLTIFFVMVARFTYSFADYSTRMLDSVGVSDLQYSVKLYTALGHCLSHIHRATESAAAYQNALEVGSSGIWESVLSFRFG